MSDKKSIRNTLLSMDIKKSYIRRAFKVYKRNFDSNFSLESILDIIVRLQDKDEQKRCRKSILSSTSNNSVNSDQFKHKVIRSSSLRYNYHSNSNINTSIDTFNSSKYYSAPSSPINSSVFPSFQPFPDISQFSNSGQSLAVSNSQCPSSPVFAYESSCSSMDEKLSNIPMFESLCSYGDVNQLKMKVMPSSSHLSNTDTCSSVCMIAEENINGVMMDNIQTRSRSITKTELKSGGYYNVNTRIKDFPPFEDHMSYKDANKLRKKDLVDHRDPFGRCTQATIVQKKGSVLKMHYIGWKGKWDAWSDYATDGYRFAKPGSISKRIAHRFQNLKVGDFIDVNPILRHPGWKCGEIRRLDHKSGQVHIVYDCEERHFLYWAHLDNENEIAEFTTKSGTNCQQKEIFPEEKQVISYYQNIPPPPPENVEKEKNQEMKTNRFPLLSPDEQIVNPFNTGDWLEVKDMKTKTWTSAFVIDKGNNWIVVHFYGMSIGLKADEKIHCIKHQFRWRKMGDGGQENENEVESKKEMANNSNMPAVHSSVINISVSSKFSLSIGNSEFKHFYDRQMRSVPTVNRLKYYNKFISFGYNDIDVIPFLVEDNLKDEIKMSPIHMRMFIAGVEIFNKSKKDFENWMLEELRMKQYLSKLLDERIVTFDIFRRRIRNLGALLDVIGCENQSDGEEIWKKLPWMNDRKKGESVKVVATSEEMQIEGENSHTVFM